jgi:hypothetical protein
VVIASIFRIVAVTQIDPEDFSFSNVGGGLWSTVEVEVGFICANLPAVRPLLFKWLGYGNSQNASGATPKYNLSHGGMRSGHVKLKSDHRDHDLMDDSSTEALTLQGNSNAFPMTNTKSRSNNMSSPDKIEPVSNSEIVVQRDFNMSINANEAISSAGGKPEHFVQITTPHNRVHLPGVANNYYGHAS